MKTKTFFSGVFLILICLAAVNLAAETVFLEELQTAADSAGIVFQNYSGPHNKIDTADEIRGIGGYLGRNVEREMESFNFFDKYRVIHAVDYSDKNGLDADIFILEKTAAVDHIKNLRRIIAGYLEAAYGYETDQADLLAEFITIYNAVHRGDIEYFTIHYKDIVNRNLDPKKCGIALSYVEWPGNTMMLIPLTPQAGTNVISDLDTDLLSDEMVIDQLRSEDDRGIEQRRELVELKDDEIDEERTVIEQKREDIAVKEKELDEKKAGLEEELRQTEDSGRAEEIKDELADVEKEKEVVATEEKALDEREEKLAEREEKVIEERERITEDQAAEIEKEDLSDAAVVTSAQPAKAKPSVDAVPFIKVSGDAGSYTGQLVMVDSVSGKIIRQSSIDTIRLRGYKFSNNGIISVAGSSGGTRIVSLVKIDPESLEITESGTAEVYIDSAVIESGGNYYAVVKDGSEWKIGIFDKALKLTGLSDAEVFAATDIVVRKDSVIAQNPAGSIIRIGNEEFRAPAF